WPRFEAAKHNGCPWMRLPNGGRGVLQYFGIILRPIPNGGMVGVARVVAKAAVLLVVNLVSQHIAKLRANASHPATCLAKLLGVGVPAAVVPGGVSPVGVLVQNDERADTLVGVGLNDLAVAVLVRLLWCFLQARGPKDKAHPAQAVHAF